jgi:hypothetical protein
MGPPGERGRVTVLSAGVDRLELEVERSRGPVASSDVAIELAPEGDGTRVTWTATFESEAETDAATRVAAEAGLAGELERAHVALQAIFGRARGEGRRARRRGPSRRAPAHGRDRPRAKRFANASG